MRPQPSRSLKIGEEIRGPARTMTAERMRWYVDVLHEQSLLPGVHESLSPGDHEENIHSSEDFAKTQGLPGIIADGPITMNWLLGMIVDVFGSEALQYGTFDVKHIRPTRRDVVVTTCVTVEAVDPMDGGQWAWRLRLWSQDPDGQALTVGSARFVSSMAAA